MEADIFEYHKEEDTVDIKSFQEEKQKLIQPTALKDPKLAKLKEALVNWINSTLKPEHIVVQSLEEDLYDGLVLHHMLSRLAGVDVPVEEMALTSPAQIRKLGLVLEELDQRLGLQDDSRIKWNVKREDPIEKLLKLEANKVNTVKKAIIYFVNQNMQTLGLQVADMDKQFADGVILLLLIGQLEGFFVPLCDFNLTPVNHSEMVHNVTLALDLLNNVGLKVSSVDPQDIVSQDVTATLKVLYALFKKHKGK
ncbi:hypothetical protein F7725_023142 [Dissostichus mawsoni]|uniref:Calponin-homology (CH) domain-containing protein n=1 Tax=Dissostichus mawsoni TaxID=36200 RepID=A0A7J5Z2S6_DISMA|nr:hypothetical protein F7725_023142 [Dissostichus mawsoni]